MKEQDIINIGNLIYDEKQINPSKLGISSRQINYWIKEGLIPFITFNTKENQSNKTKWVRLNSAQAVWACIIQELFKLNVAKTSIISLTRQIWQEPRENKYADEVLKTHIESNPLNLSEENIEQLKNILSDELLMEHYFRTIINPYTDIIKSALREKQLPYSFVFVPETSEYLLRKNSNHLLDDLNSLYLNHTVISIPLLPILSKILNTEFNDKKKNDLDYLNNIEKQIRDIVVFKKPKVVHIAFDEEHIEPIEITESHKSREKLSQYILQNKIKKGSKLLIDIRSDDNYKITLIKKS